MLYQLSYGRHMILGSGTFLLYGVFLGVSITKGHKNQGIGTPIRGRIRSGQTAAAAGKFSDVTRTPETLEIGPSEDRVPNRFFRGTVAPVEFSANSKPLDPWLAMLLPGWSYDCEMPLLAGARRVLQALGADVLAIDYDYPKRGVVSDQASKQLFLTRFHREVEVALRTGLQQNSYRRLTIVGKSLGTRGLAYLSQMGAFAGARAAGVAQIDLVWLTPLLAESEVWEPILKSHDRSLFVIGTADSHYDAAKIGRLSGAGSRSLTVIEGADHALQTSRNLSCDVDELSQALSSIERFLMAPP